MSTVQIRDVRKSYGALPVLHGVDIDIADGEFVILVGPSGCGKSTLLRMVAGLESITSGTIGIDGRVVNGLEPKDRDIAMVFQNYALYPQMTVAQNMSFALELAGVRKDEIKRKVDHAAGILGLEPLLQRKPAQLSGGQRQRVAMGRAIVRDPKVFLFDEPLSNLDAKLRVKMRAEIKALHQRLKTTIVYVTHDQIEAMTMADKIVVMQGGYIEQIGTPLELYDHPRNVFVAGFLGSPAMNFIDGVIVGDDGRLLQLGSAGRVLLSDGPRNMDGKPVIVGIRPEDIGIAEAAGVPAEVLVVEPTGSETHLAVRLGNQEITAVLRARVSLVPGEQVKLSFNGAKFHVFDKETEQRLQER
jgi:multiple sugar transport system ATP-binding protein